MKKDKVARIVWQVIHWVIIANFLFEIVYGMAQIFLFSFRRAAVLSAIRRRRKFRLNLLRQGGCTESKLG